MHLEAFVKLAMSMIRVRMTPIATLPTVLHLHSVDNAPREALAVSASMVMIAPASDAIQHLPRS